MLEGYSFLDESCSMKLSDSQLKQARKKTGLTVRQMARLIGTDYSNVCKQERGKRAITKEVLYGYRAITGVPVTKLISKKFNQIIDPMSENAVRMIEDVEEMIKPSRPNKARKVIEALNNALANLSCLKDVTNEPYEQKQTKCNNCGEPNL